MKTLKVFVLVLLSSTIAFYINAVDLEGISNKGVVRINGKLSENITVNVIIKSIFIKINKKKASANIAENYSWSRNNPDSLDFVESVVMKINNQEVFIPDSAFVDIRSVRRVKIHLADKYIALTVDCGEGGDHIVAEYKFEQSRRLSGKYQVIEKKVFPAEFKDDVWEQTVYHNDNWDNPDM